MRDTLRRLTLAALLANTFAAQRAQAQQTSAVAPGQNRISVADAQADLDQLRAVITEAHGAPYRFVAKAELDRRFDGYRAAITQPLTQFELLGHVSRMLTDLGDGHARAGLDSASARRFAAVPLLPLRVRIEDDTHLIVVGNDSPTDTTIAPGAEVLRINGRDAADILSVIRPRVPHDGFIASGRDARLARSFHTLYHYFVDQAPEFDVVVRDPSGGTRTVQLRGISEAERATIKNTVNARYDTQAAQLDGPKENISLRFSGDGTIGVLRIRGFGGDRFVAELDSVMSVARARTVRGMVLDLRGNGGGVDMYGVNVVSRFTDKPFRYFDRIHIRTLRPSFTTLPPRIIEGLDANTTRDPAGGWLATARLHPGVAEQRPASKSYLGPLVVLMDGVTFSTAADVTATLRGLGKATFIGEESGGAYEGNTSGMSALLYLNHSGIRVAMQMYGYVNAAPAPREHGRGTLPDVVLPQRVRDVLRGEDPAMARALSQLMGGGGGT